MYTLCIYFSTYYKQTKKRKRGQITLEATTQNKNLLNETLLFQRKSTEKIDKNVRNKRQKFVTSLTLQPFEQLEKILTRLQFMFLHLSWVCKRFQQEGFRQAVHFACLRRVFDWTEASRDFLEENIVMYNIKECLQGGYRITTICLDL